jgi:uncharacterized protein (TIGR00290 family)
MEHAVHQAIVSWSGGKDSALALDEARRHFEIVALLTTVTADYDRISMHGVRTELLRRQARALNYPLTTVEVSAACDNAEYETKMREALAGFRRDGVSAVVCGDIFLEDVRRYRESKLLSGLLHGVFPLWGKDTRLLARTFLDRGFQAVLCCVDTQALDGDFAGRLFDEQMLTDLPLGVDPCGENGEFHSFVFAGPLFDCPVQWSRGECVLRDGRFRYCDLLAAGMSDRFLGP